VADRTSRPAPFGSDQGRFAAIGDAFRHQSKILEQVVAKQTEFSGTTSGKPS
jgi:hypothetical protein